MAFYKKDTPESTDLLEAPNFVLNANYELLAGQYDQYTYPVDGWYWFHTIEAAYEFFGLTLPQ